MPQKADALMTDNVFLDTCIFVSEHYSSTAYRTLLRLGRIDAIKLKITDITLAEIRQQIEEKVADALKSMEAKASKTAILRNFEGYSGLMQKFAMEQAKSLSSELASRVTQELTNAGVEIISATTISAAPIFDSYFSRKPPFGDGEKRKEFPDAFVVASLIQWCEGSGQQMHVVTTDGTVRQACEASEYLYPLDSLADCVDLALRRYEDVDVAVEYLQDHSERIAEAVKQAIEDKYAMLEDQDGEGEVTVEELVALNVDDVVESDEDTMVVQCSATASLSISVSYADPNMTAYDSGEAYVFGYVNDELSRSVDLAAEVTIHWEDRPNYVVESVTLNDGRPISIWVDEDAQTYWK